MDPSQLGGGTTQLCLKQDTKSVHRWNMIWLTISIFIALSYLSTTADYWLPGRIAEVISLEIQGYFGWVKHCPYTGNLVISARGNKTRCVDGMSTSEVTPATIRYLHQSHNIHANYMAFVMKSHTFHSMLIISQIPAMQLLIKNWAWKSRVMVIDMVTGQGPIEKSRSWSLVRSKVKVT